MQQKPTDILHLLVLSAGFMNEHVPLLLKDHPLEQVMQVVKDSSLGSELEERLKNWSAVETMDVIQDAMLTCLKQSETYH